MEKRRREAVDSLVAMSAPAREHLLLGIRESVKNGMTQDPDMPDDKKKAARDFMDWLWKGVIVITEFKTVAGVKGGRAKIDFEEHSQVGVAPSLPSIQWLRAKVLFSFLPFDRSIYGKMKNPFYILLAVMSFIPFGCIRIFFFTFLLLMHLTGDTPDTYQVVNFIVTFKGTEFKSGGVVLAFYGLIQYVLCATPGDPSACDHRGPGHDVDRYFSICDVLGSLLLVFAAFSAIRHTAMHDGGKGSSQVPLLQSNYDFELGQQESQSPPQPPIHECFPPLCRLPPCIGCVRSTQTWLKGWPAGGRRIFVFVLYDIFAFFLTLLFLAWHIRFDVANQEVSDIEVIHWDWAALTRWWASDQAKATLFKARTFYHMLALPFVILMVPGISTLISLAPRTGAASASTAAASASSTMSSAKASTRAACTSTARQCSAF